MALKRSAVVLAGGPPDAVAALEPGAPNKAFIRIAGRTLVERTIAPLRASAKIGRIVVVAPASAHGDVALAEADERRPDGATMGASLRSGLADFSPDELVLVAASDLPVLSVAAVDEFLGLAERSGADLVYACVERATHAAAFPTVPHTWAKLRDGTYCGGGVVAIRPRALPALEAVLGDLGRARKAPWRLASVFGFQTLASYATGRLSVADCERRASAIIGSPVAAAVCTRAEIAINVDRVPDVALATALVRRD